MSIKRQFLLLESDGRQWVPQGGQLFDSEEEAWHWVDTRYHSDRESIRFFLSPLDLPTPNIIIARS